MSSFKRKVDTNEKEERVVKRKTNDTSVERIYICFFFKKKYTIIYLFYLFIF